MKKLLGLLLVSLFLPLNGSAQVLEGATKAIKEIKKGAEQAAKLEKVTKVPESSKVLTRYQLSLVPLQVAREAYDEKIYKILHSKMSDETKIKKINQLTEQTSPFLATLLEQNAKLYSQWGKELLKERDPKFLPPVNKMPQVPKLFSPTERVDVLANPNTVTPRFFREWAKLIESDADAEVPPEVEAMITVLGSRLETAEIFFNKEIFKQRAAHKKLQTDREHLAKHIEEIFNSQMRLSRLATKSARDVTDMIFLCNLYPSVYEESLMDLASKIDILHTQTPFTTFIRQQLNIPERIRVRGFMGEELFGNPQPAQMMERRTIGFQSPSLQPPEPIEVEEEIVE